MHSTPHLYGNLWGKFHTTTNDHYKRSDFVLKKSFVSFHGQFSKTFSSIFHWLVSLQAPIFARWWIVWHIRCLIFHYKQKSNKQKYIIILRIPKIIIKIFTFFFLVYKNEPKEYKFWWQQKSEKAPFIRTKQ